MKFYESHFEEYTSALEKYNLHPELKSTYNLLPSKTSNLENIIVYGPSGVGKYTQVLNILKNYSNRELKYDKKMTITTEKQNYIYRISDLHYEIDMSQLGCNSKILWHEIFFQIVDIISVKQEKTGIILCKNFHLIHTELLDIFYSYMQQYNHSQSNIKINFFILTEHISFIPTTIINVCQILRIRRPSKEKYVELSNYLTTDKRKPYLQYISDFKSNKKHPIENKKIKDVIENINVDGLMNIKEMSSFQLINSPDEIPKDVFNIICDNIIQEILNPNKISFTVLRDTIYDILTYNLDMTECLWYILQFFIKNNHLQKNDISEILKRTYVFLKYYNNNYRPIYHLESIIFYIINKIHNFNEL
jgi:hypothetical protein